MTEHITRECTQERSALSAPQLLMCSQVLLLPASKCRVQAKSWQLHVPRPLLMGSQFLPCCLP